MSAWNWASRTRTRQRGPATRKRRAPRGGSTRTAGQSPATSVGTSRTTGAGRNAPGCAARSAACRRPWSKVRGRLRHRSARPTRTRGRATAAAVAATQTVVAWTGGPSMGTARPARTIRPHGTRSAPPPAACSASRRVCWSRPAATKKTVWKPRAARPTRPAMTGGCRMSSTTPSRPATPAARKSGATRSARRCAARSASGHRSATRTPRTCGRRTGAPTRRSAARPGGPRHGAPSSRASAAPAHTPGGRSTARASAARSASPSRCLRPSLPTVWAASRMLAAALLGPRPRHPGCGCLRPPLVAPSWCSPPSRVAPSR
mmetsp:Transcript_74168/g.191339  ORF Transcript_74168/g.191339 Transcript_74168/m.191339 type:complete len:318 (-) Transcript_74168:345-1298(-)